MWMFRVTSDEWRGRSGCPPMLLKGRTRLRTAQEGWIGPAGWLGPESAYTRLLRSGPGLGVLVLEDASEAAALAEWELPHGGWVRPMKLRAADSRPPT